MKYLLLLLLPIFASSGTKENNNERYSESHIAELVLEKARKYNVDPKILYTIIKIESAFDPFAIAVETSYASAMMLKSLASDNIKILIGRTYHSRIWLASIFTKSESDAIFIIKLLKKLKFGFDVGLMQINTGNFDSKEVAGMIYPENNIEKGAKIFKSCTKQFKTFKNKVECYNRGGGNLRKSLRKGNTYSPYYKRYIKNYAF